MIDPRDIPAFWGLCGGLLCGAHGLVSAYSAKAGTPEARKKAWLRLFYGLVAGPIAAEALTEALILKIIPVLDGRGVAIGLGWIVTSNPRSLFDMVSRVLRAALNLEPKS